MLLFEEATTCNHSGANWFSKIQLRREVLLIYRILILEGRCYLHIPLGEAAAVSISPYKFLLRMEEGFNRRSKALAQLTPPTPGAWLHCSVSRARVSTPWLPPAWGHGTVDLGHFRAAAVL